MPNILLTTFPAHKSRNVGDDLITKSTIGLIKRKLPAFDPVILFREKSLDGFTKRVTHNVIAPGFSVSNNTYPELYKLFHDLDRIKHLFAIGCSYQHVDASEAVFLDLPMDRTTHEFLERMASNHGPFHCRDDLIVGRLTCNGIPAVYSGDMALFDPDMLHRALKVPPKDNPRIAISLQHSVTYLEQSIELIKTIKKRFPNSDIFVTLHSARNPLLSVIESRAKQLGVHSIHLHGSCDGLDAYKDIDLHIGYRLHGHIHFLRSRKPSILLVEDARSFGFSKTPGTAHGCIQASLGEYGQADDEAIPRLMAFLETQIDTSYSQYDRVLDFIDKTYVETVAPYIDDLAAKL